MYESRHKIRMAKSGSIEGPNDNCVPIQHFQTVEESSSIQNLSYKKQYNVHVLHHGPKQLTLQDKVKMDHLLLGFFISSHLAFFHILFTLSPENLLR